ncbi:helix-turn-helix domain-containing protein [Actinomadura sp. LOL_016]|uniref:AraC-like ligand-binding domain-containing protein n=1 Tax=unclassified Actinomadura TaxID=2626254 RepID=UPI003A8067B2
MISTDGVPERERFAFWREVTSKTWLPLDARCEPRHREAGFRARVGIGGLGPVQVTVMTATPHAVHRTPALIRRSDPEELLLTCAISGRGMAGEQDGRRAAFRVGDLGLYDGSRPYTAGHVPGGPVSGHLNLQFPRRSLPLPERELRRLTGVRIPGDAGVGALASRFLLRLARHMDELDPADTARLATVTLDLLTTALAHELDAHRTVQAPTTRRALLARIHVFMHQNLGDPRLTPAGIAAAHHISLRYLHKLFQEEGHTVAARIRERRLEMCRRELADARLAARPISAIAARWGFTNPAHFSQAFRDAYGLPPSQFRRQWALANAVHAD